MAAEDIDVRIELVQRKQDEGERTLLPCSHGPVVLEDVTKRLVIQ